MHERSISKIAITILIIGFMLVIPIAAQEQRIPNATYEIIYGEEINDSESLEITSSPIDPVSSVMLLNDSLTSSDSVWLKEQSPFSNYSSYKRTIAIPCVNVSEITVNLSAYVQTGPLDIWIYMHSIGVNQTSLSTIGLTQEYCNITKTLTPNEYAEDPDGPARIYFSIHFDGLNWDVISQLLFSIQVEFTVSQCPVILDLQRTNGESMYLSQTFETIYDERFKPTTSFDGFEFWLVEVNETIFLPNGNYSLSMKWGSYEYTFGDVNITNASIFLACKIKSVRLDVESKQRIPQILIDVGKDDSYGYLYPYGFLVSESPSFYIPSSSTHEILVRGGPISRYSPTHFAFDLSTESNQNITLVVNENWIEIGDFAFTPGRMTIYIASLFVMVLTLLMGRKKIRTTISQPFYLLVLSSILPTMVSISWDWYSTAVDYIEYYSVSLGISTMTSSLDGTAIAFYPANYSTIHQWTPLSFLLLLFIFLGVLLEYWKEYVNLESLDQVIAFPIFGFFLIQVFYFLDNYASYLSYPLGQPHPGFGLLASGFALFIWFYQIRQTGKPIFESSSGESGVLQ